MRDASANRRKWLKALGVTVLAPQLAAAAPRADPERALAEALVRLFRHRASARLIGREYLRLYPEEADRDWLLHSVGPDVGSADGVNKLKRVLQQKRRDDFCRGEVVMLKGCLMSRTELRLCALAALT